MLGTRAMRIDGANPKARAVAEQVLPGKTHYLIGADPRQWRTNVPTYGRVRQVGPKVQDVKPGDLVAFPDDAGTPVILAGYDHLLIREHAKYFVGEWLADNLYFIEIYTLKTFRMVGGKTFVSSNPPHLQHSNSPHLQHSNSPHLQHFNPRHLQQCFPNSSI